MLATGTAEITESGSVTLRSRIVSRLASSIFISWLDPESEFATTLLRAVNQYARRYADSSFSSSGRDALGRACWNVKNGSGLELNVICFALQHLLHWNGYFLLRASNRILAQNHR